MSVNKIILPITYFGPIQHFAYIAQNNNCLFEAHENYVKQSIRNRTVIYSANGIQYLTIPAIKISGVKSKITDVGIDNSEKWNYKHWNAIKSAYGSSPFFEYYAEDFEAILKKQHFKIWDLNILLLKQIFEILNLDTEITLTDKYIKSEELQNCIDLRYETGSIVSVFPEYIQVFDSKFGFKSNLGILDLIFNKGPESLEYLESIPLKL